MGRRHLAIAYVMYGVSAIFGPFYLVYTLNMLLVSNSDISLLTPRFTRAEKSDHQHAWKYLGGLHLQVS